MNNVDEHNRLKLGIVGVGKIARDQHIPAITASKHFSLVAAASRNSTLDGYPNFENIEAMLIEGPPLDVVSICTPPGCRDRIARAATAAGKHVMIEKPPGATVAEVQALQGFADSRGVTLFASWHSREAAGVDAARTWLAARAIKRAAYAHFAALVRAGKSDVDLRPQQLVADTFLVCRQDRTAAFDFRTAIDIACIIVFV